MSLEENLNNIIVKLNKISITEVRQIAREVGVVRPAVGKKERLISEICKIVRGEISPVAPSTRGAPPKSSSYNKEIYADIIECRQCWLNGEESRSTFIGVGDSAKASLGNRVGVLFANGDKYCLYDLADEGKIFVREEIVGRFSLKEGDKVNAECCINLNGEKEAIEIISVNGELFKKISMRPDFESLKRKNAERLINTSKNISDIAFGQRALIYGNRESVADFSKKFVEDMVKNNPDAVVSMAYICGLPEMRFNLGAERCDYFFAEFDKDEEEQLLNIRLASEYAKRRTELGKDAVLILDGVMRIAKSYNEVNRKACALLKKILASACDTYDSGSLTVIIVTEADGSAVDSAILSEFSAIVNTVLKLG